MAGLSLSDRFFSWRRSVLPWLGALLGLACVLLAIWMSLPERRPKGYTLRFSAGDHAGFRYQLARRLAEHAHDLGTELQFVEASGSLEALEKLEAGEIDVAMIQGALNRTRPTGIRQVAVLHVEPLHLLVNAANFDAVKANLSGLRGLEINVSTVGSGTNQLSLALLDFIGLKPADYRAAHASYDELLVSVDTMPDAIFTVSSLPSPIAESLIKNHGYRLVGLPFASAVRLEWASNRAAIQSVDHRHITEATIPAFTYGIDPAMPAEALQSIGTRLQVVTQERVPSEAIQSVVEAVYGTPFATLMDASIQLDLLSNANEYPLHAGARQYVINKSPIETEHVIEITEQVIGILGAIIGAAFFFGSWLRRLRASRRDLEFVASIERIVEIESDALRFEMDDAMTVDDLIEMQQEVSELKQALVRRYRLGLVSGADQLSSFLRHANDTSELISRIVLHERSPKQ